MVSKTQPTRSGKGRKAASSAQKKQTTPKQTNKKQIGSPRLYLTKKRGSTVVGCAGDGSRFATARKNVSKGKGKASAQRGRVTSNNSGARGSSTTAPKRKAAATAGGGARKGSDGGEKDIETLRDELEKATHSALVSAEEECNALVAVALDGCAVRISGKEGDGDMVEAAQRQTESSQASTMARCTAMLKALESDRAALSGATKRATAALDSLLQSENRKVKGSLDRAIDAKN